jgi:6-phosphogluconolactonase (cycloisomerase 2 family)
MNRRVACSPSFCAYFCLVTFLFVALASANAAEPTITVVSPSAGTTVGGWVYFEAYSYSTSCASGIDAMRLYGPGGVIFDTIYSNHVETFIPFPAGSDTVTFVAYDNCGGASAANVSFTVTSATGISVFLPSASSANVPVHITASAQSSVCNKVNLMQIYVAPGDAPYSIYSNTLDAFLTLAPGTYNMYVQAYDNCGNVLKQPFTVNVTTAPDKFLYATGGAENDGSAGMNLVAFQLSNGVLSNPKLVTNLNNPDNLPTDVLTQIVVDPAGYMVYAANSYSVYAFLIDRQNGTLQTVSGSPYQIIDPSSGSGGISIAMDPNGHFLYVSNANTNTISSYQIDRSDGSLYPLYSVNAPYGLLITNYTGSFLYETNDTDSKVTISGFSVDTNTGTFTPVPGSPYAVPGSYNVFGGQTTAWKYLYVGMDPTNGYEINSDGALTPLAGSPFQTSFPVTQPLADWEARYFWTETSTAVVNNYVQYDFETSDISGSGAISAPASTSITLGYLYGPLAEDYSGLYLYAGGINGTSTISSCTERSMGGPSPSCPDVFSSWKIGANGEPVPLSGPIPDGSISSIPPAALATSR